MAMSVPGHYNVLNAAAAYAVATWLGADEAAVRRQLSAYGGTYRRFQLVGTVDGIRVFDDYAHHPTEVLNTLIAARTGVGDGPGRRLLPAASLYPYSRLLGRAGSGAGARGRSHRDGCLRRPGGSDRRHRRCDRGRGRPTPAPRTSRTSRAGTTRPRPWPASPGPAIWSSRSAAVTSPRSRR